MMSTTKRLVLVFASLSLFSTFTFGQHNPDGRKVSLDCVTCHVSWHEILMQRNHYSRKLMLPFRFKGCQPLFPRQPCVLPATMERLRILVKPSHPATTRWIWMLNMPVFKIYHLTKTARSIAGPATPPIV